MTPLRTLIVDDEQLARQRLRQLLAAEAGVDVVGEATHGREALDLIPRIAPDLVFLDVQMPEMTGLELVRALGPDRMPPTVFVTAYDDHAIEAFELNALDYLLKPLRPDRLKVALDRARKAQGQAASPLEEGLRERLEALVAGLQPERRHLDRLVVKRGPTGKEVQRLLKVEEIQWVEAEDNYVRLHVADGSYLLRQTLTGLAARLDPRQFRRIHRSSLVNLDAIKEFQPWFSGDMLVVLKDGTQLTLSRTYRESFPELG